MAEQNPLVADGATDSPVNVDGFGTEGDGWLKGTGIWQNAADLRTSIDNDDTVGQIFGTATLALDVVGMALDPIGTAASMLVGWMIEHIQPLKEALDALTGDAGVIKGRADTWQNISTHLDGAAKEYAGDGVDGVREWAGDAGDAYRGHAGKLSEAMGATSELAAGMGGLITICGEGCATVRGLIHMLISELVGKLVAWAAEIAGTLGFGTPVVVAQALAEIGRVSAQVARRVQEITELISQLLKIAGQVAGHLNTIGKVIKELPEATQVSTPVSVPG